MISTLKIKTTNIMIKIRVILPPDTRKGLFSFFRYLLEKTITQGNKTKSKLPPMPPALRAVKKDWDL